MSATPDDSSVRQAEQRLLGVYLEDNDTLLDSGLEVQHFDRRDHQAAVAAMRMLVELGEQVTPLTALAEVRKQERPGSQKLTLKYLDGLRNAARADFAAIAETESLERLVRTAAHRRELHRMFAQAAGQALSDAVDPDELRDQVQASLSRQTGSEEKYLLGGSAAADDALAHLERVDAAKGGLIGLSTGLPELDDKTGGLQGEQLVFLGGATSVGKTTLMLQMAGHAVTRPQPASVYYASLEMSRAACTLKLAAGLAGVNLLRYRQHPTAHDRGKLEAALETVRQAPFYVDDAARSTSQVRAHVMRAHYQAGGLRLIVVDYMQLLAVERHRNDTTVDANNTIARGFKELATQINAPIVVLGHVNRASQQRVDKRPQLTDIKGGGVEEHLDLAMFIYREFDYDKNYHDPSAVELLIRKNRLGLKEDTVYLVDDLAHSRFKSAAKAL